MYCPNCKNQIDDNSKFCPCCGMPVAYMQPPPVMAYNAPAPAPAPVPARKKTHGCLIAFIVVLIVAVSAGLLFYFLVIKDTNHNNGAGSNGIKEIVLAAPTISGDQDASLNIIVTVYCNDNYRAVEVSLQTFDKNNRVMTSTTLRGENYIKGNTYQLKYNPTYSELLNATHYECKIVNYY